jgi:hypothetical protein
MMLVIVCVTSWLAIVGCLISMFRIAARGDEVLPPSGWHRRIPLGEVVSQSDVSLPPLPLRRFSRRMYAVHRP